MRLTILAVLASVAVACATGSPWRDFQNKTYYIGQGVPSRCFNLELGPDGEIAHQYLEDATASADWWNASLTDAELSACLEAQQAIDAETRERLDARYAADTGQLVQMLQTQQILIRSY